MSSSSSRSVAAAVLLAAVVAACSSRSEPRRVALFLGDPDRTATHLAADYGMRARVLAPDAGYLDPGVTSHGQQAYFRAAVQRWGLGHPAAVVVQDGQADALYPTRRVAAEVRRLLRRLCRANVRVIVVPPRGADAHEGAVTRAARHSCAEIAAPGEVGAVLASR